MKCKSLGDGIFLQPPLAHSQLAAWMLKGLRHLQLPKELLKPFGIHEESYTYKRNRFVFWCVNKHILYIFYNAHLFGCLPHLDALSIFNYSPVHNPRTIRKGD